MNDFSPRTNWPRLYATASFVFTVSPWLIILLIWVAESAGLVQFGLDVDRPAIVVALLVLFVMTPIGLLLGLIIALVGLVRARRPNKRPLYLALTLTVISIALFASIFLRNMQA